MKQGIRAQFPKQSYLIIEKSPRGDSYSFPGKFGVYRYSDQRYGWVNDYEQRRQFLGVYDTLIEAVRAHPGAEIPDDI